MARIGRWWGSDDVFGRLLDEVHGNPQAMTPEITLDIDKTNDLRCERTQAVAFLRQSTQPIVDGAVVSRSLRDTRLEGR